MALVKLPILCAGATLSDATLLELIRGNTEISLKLNSGNILADNFNDNSIDAAKWTKKESSAGFAVEQNGRWENNITSSPGWNNEGFISAVSSTGNMSEISFTVIPAANTGCMIGFAKSFAIANGAYIYFLGDGTGARGLHLYIGGSDVAGPFTTTTYTVGKTYNCRISRLSATTWRFYIQSPDDANFSTEQASGTISWTPGAAIYFSMNLYRYSGTASAFVDNVSWGSYASSSPTAILVDTDSGIAGSIFDMSSISNRENLGGETGSINYKYAYGEDVNPTNWNASWLTLAQLQAEADVTGRYFRLQSQHVSDGTKNASLQDLTIDATITSASGGGKYDKFAKSGVRRIYG